MPELLASQLGYQLRLLLRTPRAAVGGVVLPVLLLALHGGDTRLVAGLAVLGVTSTAYITHTSGLVAARQAGVLKRWRLTPLPAWCYFAGRIGATVLLAAAGGAATVAAAAGLFGTHVDARAVPALAAALVLGAVTWASIGTAASALIPSADAAWPLLGLSYLPLVLLSGGFGAVDGEPAWLARAMTDLPVQPLVDSVTRALHGRAPFSPHALAIELGWAAAGLLLAQRWFRWEP